MLFASLLSRRHLLICGHGKVWKRKELFVRVFGYTYSNGSALCAEHAALLTSVDLAALNENGSAYAVYSWEELHSDLVCDVDGCGVILARNCVDGCGDNDQMQRVLESAQELMEGALQQRGLGARLAGTRVLQSLVMVLARQFLTLEQQEQIEAILELHESCVRR